MRKDYTPSERVAIIEALYPKEEEEAKKRQGTRTDIQPSENFSESDKGEAKEKAAKKAGWGGRNFQGPEREPRPAIPNSNQNP